MLVRIAEIASKKSIQILGTEAWLGPIAASIANRKTNNGGLGSITGDLNLRADSAGFIYGSGTIRHTPVLTCSRCDLEIPWPIEAKIDVSWRPAFESHAPQELTLTHQDLDVYFIENGSIDIAQLILDTLNFALPSQLPVRRDDTDDCGICGESLASTLVYGEAEQERPLSPFSALKDLKL
ncbi:MAG: DUF177 domain-containing protein [Proteobacteria bacterium]|nr:DUF177 domain-containing protein [Pseudomonadota bacterium]